MIVAIQMIYSNSNAVVMVACLFSLLTGESSDSERWIGAGRGWALFDIAGCFVVSRPPLRATSQRPIAKPASLLWTLLSGRISHSASISENCIEKGDE